MKNKVILYVSPCDTEIITNRGLLFKVGQRIKYFNWNSTSINIIESSKIKRFTPSGKLTQIVLENGQKIAFHDVHDSTIAKQVVPNQIEFDRLKTYNNELQERISDFINKKLQEI